MLVKEFLTKLNLLVNYTFNMASLDRTKLDVFIGGLRRVLPALI